MNDHFNGITFYLPKKYTYLIASRYRFSWRFLWRILFYRHQRSKKYLIYDDTAKKIVNSVNNNLHIETYVLAHSTVLLQTHGLNIITDPVYSNIAGPLNLLGARRYNPVAIDKEQLPKIDIVLISHMHYDHCDFATLQYLINKYQSLIICPIGLDYLITKELNYYNVIALDWYDGYQVNKSLTVHATPAYHWTKRGFTDRNKSLWVGFVMEFHDSQKNVYFAGDTAFGNGVIFQELVDLYQGFDLTFLPVGAYKPKEFLQNSHTSPYDALKIHKMINSQCSIAIHKDTFQLAQDQYQDAYYDLLKAKRELKMQDVNFLYTNHGDLITIT